MEPTRPLPTGEFQNARECAELMLTTDHPTTTGERTLARYVLGLLALVEDRSTIQSLRCATCGETYSATTREMATAYHNEVHPDHQLTIPGFNA